MLTKELQNLSDKLTGGHSSAHEISKQVDYIEKNYSGGGSGGGVFTIEAGPKEDDSDSYELKATWQEIYDALKAGKLVVVHPADDETIVYNSVTLVLTANYDGDTYRVAGITYTNDIAPEVYTCSTPDERPYVGSGQNPGDES